MPKLVWAVNCPTSHEYDLLICMVSARQLYCLIKPSLLQNIYCWTYIHYMKPTGIAVLSAIFSLQLSRFAGCDITTIETYVICAIFCNLITIRWKVRLVLNYNLLFRFNYNIKVSTSWKVVFYIETGQEYIFIPHGNVRCPFADSRTVDVFRKK